MMKRVDPLHKELKDLETKAEDTRQKGEEITKIIAELEASIAKYKEEYAMVISDASVIKNDLSTVEKKVVGLNVSSATTPELLLKRFDHYCEYKRTPNGVVMAPSQLGKWLALFCDEINLPDLDKWYSESNIVLTSDCRARQILQDFRSHVGDNREDTVCRSV
ncbi:PREDICTED: cytoplasmic dynein 1 heavy chain 1-like [Amphimedon queenslandica]|nr:PREDICTED: cytoplasmic dynein 1 heavy chain 1-like [Amphimedon queenslandica]|eukprot:XP_019861963.1 PREDICTED: cytoplasmic dynein 1 heavy chain 1-like [Amphimedon queenslandica]